MPSEINTTPTAEPPSPSTAFARLLKTYDDITYGKNSDTRPMVVAFNKDLFIRTCSKLSDDYDENKCNYDDIMTELFQVGETWISRDLVALVVKLIAEKHGWKEAKRQIYIQCNRYGEDEKEPLRNFANGTLRVNCSLRIVLKALVTTSYLSESQNGKDIKRLFKKNDWDKPVEIKEGSCTVHGGNCHPGRQNRVAVMSRAGAYVKKMPDSALFSLCNIAEFGGKLTASSIRNVMSVAWPSAKLTSKHDVFNLRVKVMKLMPIFRKSNNDYEAFKEVVNASDMLQGIDNEELNDDEAYQLGQSLWLELVNTTDTKEEAMMSFIEYLELIKSRARGFTYKLAEDTSEQKKKLLGVIWMTATMRRNFELFGGYICLDMMKRGLNTLLWPYVAVTMYDENMKLCLACEGILCGERVDMYQFVADFLGESAPGRPLSEVNIVAGDGFFDQDMIITLGFINACFITDQWHLLDSGLSKMFGKSAYTLLQGHLVGMVKAASEAEFDDTLKSANDLLAVQAKRNGQTEQDLAEFASRRKTYASYCIGQIAGNLGRHGSSISESNHASALSHLNDGIKGVNGFCEHPIILIRELLKRQKIQVAKSNDLLWQDCQKMRVVRSNLSHLPSTAETQDLMNAAQELCLSSYKRYAAARERSIHYRVDSEYVQDPELPQDVCTAVINTLSEARPRLFKDFSSRCDCRERMANEEMCTHEIIAKGGFRKLFFSARHMARESVSGSTVGWVEADATEQSNSIDAMLGYELENLQPTTSIVGIASADADGDMGMVNATTATAMMPTIMPAQQAVPVLPPPGYLRPKTVGTVKPLPKKHVQNVLTTTIDAYNGMTEDRKHLISSLVLDLENKLTIDTTQSKTLKTKRSNHFVVVPTNACIATQPKNRLLPSHELVANKKLKSSPPYNGLAQDWNESVLHEIILNSNVRTIKCGFCTENHMITTCKKKQAFCMDASEYVLTTENPQNEDTLRSRMKCMPVTGCCGKGSAPYDSVAKDNIANNFIIHEARSMESSRIFKVSFVGKDGNIFENNRSANIWITTKAMNSLTTHNNKKKKYVYDRTIIAEQV